MANGINHILGYGQSLSTGEESGKVLTTKPFDRNILMMQANTFVPYYNQSTENPLGGLGIALSELGDSKYHKILMSSHGVGGFSIEKLSKDTVPYTNLLKEVQKALTIASSKKKTIMYWL